jgi:hypothetical protein
MTIRPSRAVWLLQERKGQSWLTVDHPATYPDGVVKARASNVRARVMLGETVYFDSGKGDWQPLCGVCRGPIPCGCEKEGEKA